MNKSQFARERGAIYRRDIRVRVLNGPNWAGLDSAQNTKSGRANLFSGIKMFLRISSVRKTE
jgi:hypothetical protein